MRYSYWNLCQVPIFMIDGSEFTVEQLPLVGSEIEVTTESDYGTRPVVTDVKFGTVFVEI